MKRAILIAAAVLILIIIVGPILSALLDLIRIAVLVAAIVAVGWVIATLVGKDETA